MLLQTMQELGETIQQIGKIKIIEIESANIIIKSVSGILQ